MGKYGTDVVPFMNTVNTFRTRGNDRRPQKVRCEYDLRKYCFTNRVVNIWNSLPNWVVMTDPTHHPKRHPDPLSHFATVHFADRLTDGLGGDKLVSIPAYALLVT